MQFNAVNADHEAIKMIQLLIQQNHYTQYDKDAVIDQIVQDAGKLSKGMTNTAAGTRQG